MEELYQYLTSDNSFMVLVTALLIYFLNQFKQMQTEVKTMKNDVNELKNLFIAIVEEKD